MVGQPAEGVDLDQIDAWFRDRPMLGEVAAELTAIPMHAGAPSDVPKDDAADRFCQLWFVDDEITEVWEDTVRPPRRGLRRRRARPTSCWSPRSARTVPGTDRYTDQLW